MHTQTLPAAVQTVKPVDPPPQNKEKEPVQPQGKSFLDMLKEVLQKQTPEKNEDPKAVSDQRAEQTETSGKKDGLQKMVLPAVKKAASKNKKTAVHEDSSQKNAAEHTLRISVGKEKKESPKTAHDTKAATEQRRIVSDTDKKDTGIVQTNLPAAKKKKKSTQSYSADHAEKAGSKNKPYTETGSEKSELADQPKRKSAVAHQKPVFSVQDERTVAASDSLVHTAGGTERVAADAPVTEFKVDLAVKPQRFFNMSTVQARSDSANGMAQGAAQTFSDLLSQELQNRAPDFVQAGKIILRDHNQGAIRLSLRPAHLGAVKINLELSGDKRIKGTVLVNSREAYDAVEKSMDSLIQAFEENGFDSADFNLSQNGFADTDPDQQVLLRALDQKKIADPIMPPSEFADTWDRSGIEQIINVLA